MEIKKKLWVARVKNQIKLKKCVAYPQEDFVFIKLI
jgi:hypothetical protein